jgi:CheY-like chemotaxis protein
VGSYFGERGDAGGAPSGDIMPELHALLVEDELLIALDLQSMLSELGFTSFAFAGTARQALEQAQMQSPDLVTVDLGLLDGDGFEAVDAIQAACGPVAAIYVTGDSDVALRRPEAVVLQKPVATHALAFALLRARAAADRARLGGDPDDRHGTVTGPR